MFTTLIETDNHARGGSARGTVISVVTHAALIVATVIVTLPSEYSLSAREIPVGPVYTVLPPRSERPATPSRSPANRRAQDASRAPEAPRRVDLQFTLPVDDLASEPVVDLADGGEVTFGPGVSSIGGTVLSGDAGGGEAGVVRDVGTVDRPPRLRDGSAPPRYPESLRSAGIDGSVTLEFVVDSGGSVEQESVSVIAATHPAFTAAASDAVRRYRFSPGMASGARVRTRMRQSFQFSLR